MMVLVVLLGFGCGKDDKTELPAAEADSITITSVSPSTATAGIPTTFTISVSYSLKTKDSGVINYGFHGSGSGLLQLDEKIVSKGTGTASFVVTQTMYETNKVEVLLSENPHPASWTPLAWSSATITVY